MVTRLRGSSVFVASSHPFHHRHWPNLTGIKLHNFCTSPDTLSLLLTTHEATLRTLGLGVIGLLEGTWQEVKSGPKDHLATLEAVYLLCIEDNATFEWKTCSAHCRRTEYETALLGKKETKWVELEQMMNHVLGEASTI